MVGMQRGMIVLVARVQGSQRRQRRQIRRRLGLETWWHARRIGRRPSALRWHTVVMLLYSLAWRAVVHPTELTWDPRRCRRGFTFHTNTASTGIPEYEVPERPRDGC